MASATIRHVEEEVTETAQVKRVTLDLSELEAKTLRELIYKVSRKEGTYFDIVDRISEALYMAGVYMLDPYDYFSGKLDASPLQNGHK